MDPSNRSNRFAGPQSTGGLSNARSNSSSPPYYSSYQVSGQTIRHSESIPIPYTNQMPRGHDNWSDNEHSSDSGPTNSSQSNTGSGRSSDSDLFPMDLDVPHSPDPVQSIAESDQRTFWYTPPPRPHRIVPLASWRCPYCNQTVREYEARAHTETCPRRRDSSSDYELSLPSRAQFLNLSSTNASRQGHATATQVQLTNNTMRNRFASSSGPLHVQMSATETRPAQNHQAGTGRNHHINSVPQASVPRPPEMNGQPYNRLR